MIDRLRRNSANHRREVISSCSPHLDATEPCNMLNSPNPADHNRHLAKLVSTSPRRPTSSDVDGLRGQAAKPTLQTLRTIRPGPARLKAWTAMTTAPPPPPSSNDTRKPTSQPKLWDRAVASQAQSNSPKAIELHFFESNPTERSPTSAPARDAIKFSRQAQTRHAKAHTSTRAHTSTKALGPRRCAPGPSPQKESNCTGSNQTHQTRAATAPPPSTPTSSPSEPIPQTPTSRRKLMPRKPCDSAAAVQAKSTKLELRRCPPPAQPTEALDRAAVPHVHKSSSRDRQAHTAAQALRRRRCAPGPSRRCSNCAVAPPARATNPQRRLALLSNKRGTSSQERSFHTLAKALGRAAVPQAQLRRLLSARAVSGTPPAQCHHKIHTRPFPRGRKPATSSKTMGTHCSISWYPVSQ